MSSCDLCDLHGSGEAHRKYDINRHSHWILRHHPDPSPLADWLLLDARRHMGGPLEFTSEESSTWGAVGQQASRLVQQLTGCDRVYAIAFGEGARHLHLIPRFGSEPASEAWKVVDLYRAVTAGSQPAAKTEAVAQFVERARQAHLAFAP